MLDAGCLILDETGIKNQEPHIQYQESRIQHQIFFGSGLSGLAIRANAPTFVLPER